MGVEKNGGMGAGEGFYLQSFMIIKDVKEILVYEALLEDRIFSRGVFKRFPELNSSYIHSNIKDYCRENQIEFELI